MSSDSEVAPRLPLYPAIVGAAILFVIGVRFMLMPESAAQTFGVSAMPKGYEFHYVIGLRDLWLALLAGAAAWFRDWRSLALWFGFGALVCFADAAIVTSVGGPGLAIAFHVVCGVLCVLLTLLYRWKAVGAHP